MVLVLWLMGVFWETMASMSCHTILSYLARVYELNPEAEVSGPELQHELGLNPATVQSCVRLLAGQGLVEWDPLLANTWLRITDAGLAVASDAYRG